jgi:branched-chain amino acid transport system ATP-binding protein
MLMQSASPILEASGIAMRFGGVKALTDVSIRVHPGEVLGIIGPNGAGKTTLFNVFSGFLRPTGGKLYYDGINIARLGPDQRCRLGLMRTWQLPRSFATMSVRENIVLAAVAARGRIADVAARVDAILDTLGLEPYAAEAAADLPPGQRKRLELARALVRNPRLLLLDEVLSGQTAGEADELFAILKQRVREEGLTIVMIEHVIRAVRSLCDRVIVLSDGRVLAEGTPAEVMSRPDVVSAYIGAPDPGGEPTMCRHD